MISAPTTPALLCSRIARMSRAARAAATTRNNPRRRRAGRRVRMGHRAFQCSLPRSSSSVGLSVTRTAGSSILGRARIPSAAQPASVARRSFPPPIPPDAAAVMPHTSSLLAPVNRTSPSSGLGRSLGTSRDRLDRRGPDSPCAGLPLLRTSQPSGGVSAREEEGSRPNGRMRLPPRVSIICLKLRASARPRFGDLRARGGSPARRVSSPHARYSLSGPQTT
jgi:hypothetical protein